MENESVYLKEGPERDMFVDMKVDRSHRHWATWGNERPRGRMTDAFRIWTLASYETRNSAMSGTNFMSRAFWPMPLISYRMPNVEAR